MSSMDLGAYVPLGHPGARDLYRDAGLDWIALDPQAMHDELQRLLAKATFLGSTICPFDYTTGTRSLADGGSDSFTLTINTDAIFVCTEITYRTTLTTIPKTDLRLRRGGISAELMSGAIDVASKCSVVLELQDQLPVRRVLPYPGITFLDGSTIQGDVTDRASGAAQSYAINFQGYKLYRRPGALG